MADRRLVEYQEQRAADGPYWTLIVERSAAGAPGGLVTIHYASVDGTLDEQQMTVVLDDLRRLQPALDWAGRSEPTVLAFDREKARDVLADSVGYAPDGPVINRALDLLAGCVVPVPPPTIDRRDLMAVLIADAPNGNLERKQRLADRILALVGSVGVVLTPEEAALVQRILRFEDGSSYRRLAARLEQASS